MNLSKRIGKMDYSAIRGIVPNLNAAVARGTYVHQMHIGQPNIETPATYFEGLKNFNERITKYADSRGITELLDAFKKSYAKLGIELTTNDMLITSGGSEALTFAIDTICDAGDEVLLLEPYYSNYDSFLKMSDAVGIPIPLIAEKGYCLPPVEEIEKKITPRTKAILFSNPNNPLGTVLSEEDMNTICYIAKQYKIFIITDEVYRSFIYDDVFYQSFLNMPGMEDYVILTDSVSKHYSACGARVGVLASKNREFIDQTLKLCQARLSVSTIEQLACSRLLATSSEYTETVRQKYIERRNVFCSRLSEIPGVSFVFPQSTFYVFVKLPVEDTENFAKYMLDEFTLNGETVSFAIGSGFYADKELGKQKARFSFCASEPEELERCAEILKEGLASYNKQNVLLIDSKNREAIPQSPTLI